MFNPGLEIGQELSNAEIVEIFKCGNMGGMRRSNTTNTLVLVSDYTKGLYHDKWIGGILHYTGMGKNGDQDLNFAQNATLAAYGSNDVDIHLFEVIEEGIYVYCGRIELVSAPYQENQPGEDGLDRQVWMFPIRPVPDNDVRKPPRFVFPTMEAYLAHGKAVDKEYVKLMTEKKKKKTAASSTTLSGTESMEEEGTIPRDLIGKTLIHKTLGEGIITGIVKNAKDAPEKEALCVTFPEAREKKFLYYTCLEKKLIEIL